MRQKRNLPRLKRELAALTKLPHSYDPKKHFKVQPLDPQDRYDETKRQKWYKHLFFTAYSNGRGALVEELLRYPEISHADKSEALQYAVFSAFFNVVEVLLADEGSNRVRVLDNNAHVLHHAAYRGDVDLFGLLLTNVAQSDATDFESVLEAIKVNMNHERYNTDLYRPIKDMLTSELVKMKQRRTTKTHARQVPKKRKRRFSR